jgi:hypothetical protein
MKYISSRALGRRTKLIEYKGAEPRSPAIAPSTTK